MSELRALRSVVRPYRFRLAMITLLMLASSVALLAVPWLAGSMIGSFLTAAEASQTWLVALLIGALGIMTCLNYAVARLSTETAAHIVADLRLNIYQHVQALPISFHQLNRQGDMLALMTNEVDHLGTFLTATLTNAPIALFTVAGAALLMFRIDPILALLVPILVPAFFLIFKIVGRRLRRLSASLQQAEAGILVVAEENLGMLPAVKAFTRETQESRRYKAVTSHAMNLTIAVNRVFAALQPLIAFIAASAAVLFLFVAGRSVQSGAMSPADLLRLLMYAALLAWPVGTLGGLFGQIQKARGTIARMQRVFAEPQEPGYRATGRLGRIRGDIAFDNVSFAYPGREPVFTQMNLHISPGEIVALTGPNGAGKSTFVSLLMRFHDPDAGIIRLDGQDIAGIDVREVRAAIGLVPQRSLLFNGTIRHNVGYGLDATDDERIMEALELAQASDFVRSLPAGLDTEIGDHGVRLSGGQQQRIALARALIKEPQVLILDEATSMYDAQSELAFFELCREAFRDRTVILITHRPASLALASRIVTIEVGRIRERTAETSAEATAGRSEVSVR